MTRASGNREMRWPMADSGTAEPRRAALEPVVVDQLPDPVTGEALEPTPRNAARVRLLAGSLINQYRDLQHICDAILAEESRRQGTKTLHLADGITVVITGGTTLVPDPVELQENLRDVGCPEERINAAVVETITYKVNRSVLAQLRAANPLYAQAIELASRIEEKPWRAAIK